MDVNYARVEETIKASYRLATAQYRRDDEIEVTTPNHDRLARRLSEVCRSFSHPTTVLDVGCGTGRYFHCLTNVELLVGMDISDDMLTAARRPVFENQLTARSIELMRGNAYLAEFPPATFDFIYSLGMFGHGCPVNGDILSRFHQWLRPGGKLFFNTVDFAGLPSCHRVKRRVRNLLFPWLTSELQRKLKEREQRAPFFALTEQELTAIVSGSRFAEYSISSHRCESPLWRGQHLECLARKKN